jgi:hypothetical protein
MLATVAKVGNTFDRLVAWACWPAVKLLNLLLRPDPLDGGVSGIKVLLWLLANCALLAAILLLMRGPGLLIALSAFLLFHVLVVLSSLRIMSQEKRVMEGALDREHMTLSAQDAVNNISILGFSTLFYVFGLAALIQLAEGAKVVEILKRKPVRLSTEYGQYLVCVLNEVPLVNTAVQTWANLTSVADNLNAEIAYSGLAGNAVRLLIVLTVSVIVVRALVLRLQQLTHQAAIAASLETRDADLETLHRRLVRVPSFMRERLDRMAASHPDHAVRERARSALSKLKVIASPAAYLKALGRHVALPEAELKAMKDTLAALPAGVVRMPAELGAKLEQQLRSKAGALGKEAGALVEDIKGLLGGRKK